MCRSFCFVIKFAVKLKTARFDTFLNPFSDTCYVLSFAVIMLNTSLHNPNVKDKPSVQRFTAMNRGINDGGDLPEDLLRVSQLLFLSLEK